MDIKSQDQTRNKCECGQQGENSQISDRIMTQPLDNLIAIWDFCIDKNSNFKATQKNDN